jgi:hypothetical protein
MSQLGSFTAAYHVVAEAPATAEARVMPVHVGRESRPPVSSSPDRHGIPERLA